MSQPKGTSLSLRPFPISDTKPKALGDFIGRVNAHPGGFRELSEEKLRQDIEQQKNASGNGQDVDMSDDEDEAGEDEGADGNEAGSQDVIQGRIQVLQNIEYVTHARRY